MCSRAAGLCRVDFSPHDPDTMYLLVAHYYWNNMDPTNSPAGLWRSADRGTTSEGLQRSTDGGATWETVVPDLANRRIKTVMAVTNAAHETILYTIAEKTMPRHITGQKVPLD